MRVTSASASRCSAVSPAYMSPLPPGSSASTICGNTSQSRRMAWAWIENTFGMAIGVAVTNGTAPSHTSVVFSMQLMVLSEPPLPPNT